METPMTTNTRRAHERLDVDFDVMVRVGDREIASRCLNISQGGMFIEGAHRPMGELVTLIFELPDLPAPVEAEARVCWTERDDRTGFGVQFIGLRAIQVWAINQLFQRRSRGQL
jgi:hypothetical protein